MPVVLFLVSGWLNRWITDDGFIYLRVVRQLRAGNGPVFNVGERVEAFTGTIWVALLAFADFATPVRLEWLAVILGLVFGGIGIATATVGARRLHDGDHAGQHWFVPLGMLVFVAVTAVWVFATSGLETGLTFGWLGLCFLVLVTWAQGSEPMPLVRAVVLGLGWLVRPELALFSAVFVVIVVAADWQRTSWPARMRTTIAMLALPVAYQVFRMGYFGSLVPNTALAKSGGSANWERGWEYLVDFAEAYALWLPAVVILAGGYAPLALTLRDRGDTRTATVVAAFAGCALLHGLYVVAIGGD